MAVGVDFLSEAISMKPSPKQSDQIIGSLPAYVAEPNPANVKTGKAIIYLTDSAGIWHNSRMLADQFAATGYLTIVCFNAGVVRSEGASLMEAQTTPLNLNDTISAISVSLNYLIDDRQITSIGSIGYSGGSSWVLALCAAKAVNAGFIAHPSDLDVNLLKNIKAPLSVAAADEDDREADWNWDDLKKERDDGKTGIGNLKVKDMEAVMSGNGYPFEICVYNDVHRGFATRRTAVTREERWARDKSFAQAVKFMDMWL